MNRRIPAAIAVMTPFPYAIAAEDTVEVAKAMMQQHGIHHLPVMHAGKLAGIVSARDIGVSDELLAGRERTVPLAVWAICSRDPYVVEVDERLDRIADELAQRHIGSALVTKHGKLAGIITTTDVCRTLASLLRESAGADDSGDDVVA
ncbi:MAG: CBS domain-containing protein [Nannocystaceae bacterium]